jgi:hypothetical protein
VLQCLGAESEAAPVAYVGALQARLDSERNRKRCACGGVGTPRCTWRSPGAPGVFFFSKKAHLPGAPGDLQVHLGISRCNGRADLIGADLIGLAGAKALDCRSLCTPWYIAMPADAIFALAGAHAWRRLHHLASSVPLALPFPR